MSLRNRFRLACCLILGLTPGTFASVGEGSPAFPADPGEHGGSLVIRARYVYPATEDGPARIAGGVIIVREGKIVDVGPDLAIPDDLPFIDLTDEVVIPGLVAAAGNTVPAHRGDESIAAAYRSIDAFDFVDDHRGLLAGGVTTVHLSPGEHRLVTGQGAVVKVAGPADERVLIEAADLSIHLGEAAFNPPEDVTFTTPSSADLAIPPARRQRPATRLGQIAALDEALREQAEQQSGDRLYHGRAFARAWAENRALRIHADRAVDMAAAWGFLSKQKRRGYLVGGAEAAKAGGLGDFSVPLVYRIESSFPGLPTDRGLDPDMLDRDLSALSGLRGRSVALAVDPAGRIADLRLTAALAGRAGWSEEQVVAAITRVPAEILGVADRVGSIAPGKDADLVVLSWEPLKTTSHVISVLVNGRRVFQAPESRALVVRAGTIWVDETTRLKDGEVLIEDGRISAVAHSVPYPRFARVIDAGPEAFVAPGFIDAHGHLGLERDRSVPSPQLVLSRLVGAANEAELRVARAGVTTVLLAPYSSSPQGSQIAAVKTAGDDRDARVVRATAGVIVQLRADDPAEYYEKLKQRLEQGKKYLEKWEKYRKELAEWEEKKAKGELTQDEGQVTVEQKAEKTVDPISGTWTATLTGGPMPEPQTATIRMQLRNGQVEGRITMPGMPEEFTLTGTFDGSHLSGQLEVETPYGFPTIEADLVEEDHLVGTIGVADVEIDLDARRTDRAPVEFRVVKRKGRGKDGRPLPPKVDEALEPLKAVLEGEIVLLVEARTAAQINAVLEAAEEFQVSVVLLDADEAAALADRLEELEVGVVVPERFVRLRNDAWYHQADDLSRKGIDIAFQSKAEDAARALPLKVLQAVERGLSADAAIAAFTTEPSRMFKLDDRIGSVAAGKDADLVIFSGQPFEAGSRVERVIISGEVVR